MPQPHDHDSHHHHHDGHDHSHEVQGDANTQTLWEHIDRERVRCLNESVQDAGRSIIKPWHERDDASAFLESDADQQVLLHVPFTGSVKLHSLLLRSSDTASAPSVIKLFLNQAEGGQELDFDAAEEIRADEELQTVQSRQHVEYPLKRTKWSNTHSISVFVKDNHGRGSFPTRIYYLGFKGEVQSLHGDLRHLNIIYEAAANPKDHKAFVPPEEQFSGLNR